MKPVLRRRQCDNRTVWRGSINNAILVCVLVVFLLTACADKPGTAGRDNEPSQRALLIETDGCPLSSGRTGSGVAVGPGLGVTVAHLIVRAREVRVSIADEPLRPARVLAVDLERDLAALEISDEEITPISTSEANRGDTGKVVGGARSGNVDYEIARVVELTIEEVLGNERHARRGYELNTRLGDGDSGAGAYDEDGNLIGILFATGVETDSAWLTASSEVLEFLDNADLNDVHTVCEE